MRLMVKLRLAQPAAGEKRCRGVNVVAQRFPASQCASRQVLVTGWGTGMPGDRQHQHHIATASKCDASRVQQAKRTTSGYFFLEMPACCFTVLHCETPRLLCHSKVQHMLILPASFAPWTLSLSCNGLATPAITGLTSSSMCFRNSRRSLSSEPQIIPDCLLST
jgi:hypothetical protein